MAVKKTDFSVISHAQRMKDKSLSRIEYEDKDPGTESIEVQTPVLVNGVKSVRKEIKTQKCTDRVKGLNWYDFSIDSLCMTGAIANQTFSQLNANSVELADSLDGQVPQEVVNEAVSAPVEENKNIEE